MTWGLALIALGLALAWWFWRKGRWGRLEKSVAEAADREEREALERDRRR